MRSSDGSLQTHLAFGCAGFIARWSYPAYDYEDDVTHEMRHVPAASGWSAGYPMCRCHFSRESRPAVVARFGN